MGINLAALSQIKNLFRCGKIPEMKLLEINKGVTQTNVAAKFNLFQYRQWERGKSKKNK